MIPRPLKMWLLLVVTQLMMSGRAGLEQSSAEDRHDFDHEQQPQHSGQQNLVPAHREIESLLSPFGAAFSEFEWEAGLLLILQQRYFLTYEALLFVSRSIHEHYSRNMAIVHIVHEL